MTSSIDDLSMNADLEGMKKLIPEKRKLTELAKHDGWIENLRNEERTMKE